MSFFLLWTLNTMHLFFRGLSVNLLIAALKRFEISGHLKHIFWLTLTHLPCFDPCSCEIDLSLFIYFIIILFLGDTNSPYQPWFSKLYHITLAIQIVGCFFVEVGRFWWAFGLKIINPIWQHCALILYVHPGTGINAHIPANAYGSHIEQEWMVCPLFFPSHLL